MTSTPHPLTPKGRWSVAFLRHLAAEAGGLCQYCGEPADENGGAHVDHIVAKSQGGSDDRSNLRFCCYSCNSAKRDRTVEEFRRNCMATATLAGAVVGPRVVLTLDSLGYDMGLVPFVFHFEKGSAA